MDKKTRNRIEFGDFQTPISLANKICFHLRDMGFQPDVLIEPTCGTGAFLQAGSKCFGSVKKIFGFDINNAHIKSLEEELRINPCLPETHLECIDFFKKDWKNFISGLQGRLLFIGNLPWVTNAALGVIGGENIPKKSNFSGMKGFDAISGKSNFDISEWMLLEILRGLSSCGGDAALLVKTSAARKTLAHAEREKIPITKTNIISIDAKKYFSAAVDACLFVIQSNPNQTASYDSTVFANFEDEKGRKTGIRDGFLVSNLNDYEKYSFILGNSPKKWRSGIKHDAAKIMEFIRLGEKFQNGFGEQIELEPEYLFPLMKGADVGSNKNWQNRFVLVPQCCVGADTSLLKITAPKTWRYLEMHAEQLDARASIIYLKNPRFSIFGVGDYAFKPWRIAICSLYKHLGFRLVGPIEGHPVMFDDTVYYLSFDTQQEASEVFELLQSEQVTGLLSSLIFWDEKRPVKTAILNRVNWSKISRITKSGQLELTV